MSETEAIETIMFDAPSGDVRGIVTAFADVKGKRKRVAHATILVGKEPSVTLDVPKAVTIGDVPGIAAVLQAFTAKVTSFQPA